MGIVGCGKVGRVIARRLVEAQVVKVTGILNRTEASADEAARFIGQGLAIRAMHELPESDVIMIGCSDDQISSCVSMLLQSGRMHLAPIVFHCSGAHSSELLSPLASLGASTGSVHMVKSFADPHRAYSTFEGTYCGIEGERRCANFLTSAIERSGGVAFRLSPETKLLYHAGAVFVCNYVTALIETGIRSFEQAGLAREFALRTIQPFVSETIKNNFELGTHTALTGPIARGDKDLVHQQFEAVKSFSELAADVYAALGKVAVELSRKQGVASTESLQSICLTLDRGTKS